MLILISFWMWMHLSFAFVQLLAEFLFVYHLAPIFGAFNKFFLCSRSIFIPVFTATSFGILLFINTFHLFTMLFIVEMHTLNAHKSKNNFMQSISYHFIIYGMWHPLIVKTLSSTFVVRYAGFLFLFWRNAWFHWFGRPWNECPDNKIERIRFLDGGQRIIRSSKKMNVYKFNTKTKFKTKKLIMVGWLVVSFRCFDWMLLLFFLFFIRITNKSKTKQRHIVRV